MVCNFPLCRAMPQEVGLSNNRLTGPIPDSWGRIAHPGTRVWLEHNYLSCCGIDPVEVSAIPVTKSKRASFLCMNNIPPKVSSAKLCVRRRNFRPSSQDAHFALWTLTSSTGTRIRACPSVFHCCLREFQDIIYCILNMSVI